MELELPVSLENGVKILSQSEDGVFKISYLDAGQSESIVYWPDRFKRFKESNEREGKAIRLVQAFIIDRLCG